MADLTPEEQVFARKMAKKTAKVKDAMREADISPPAATLKIKNLGDVEPARVSWMWYPRIPYGYITLVDGDPGVGKSWLTLALAAAVSNGLTLPGQEVSPVVGDVLLIGAEDGIAETIVPRLIAVGADRSRVDIIEAVTEYDGERVVDLSRHLPEIEAAFSKKQYKMLIIDPIQAHLGSGTDMHRANETRAVLAPLAQLASRQKCAVLLVRHMRKSSGDNLMYRGLGSIDIAGASRSILMVGEDPDNPNRRGVVHVKASMAAKAPPIAYTLTDGKFAWDGEAPELAGNRMFSGQPDEEDSAVDVATKFLRDTLEGRELSATFVYENAAASGIKRRTLERAKKDLAVRSEKRGKEWYWKLPSPTLTESTPPAPIGGNVGDVAMFPENPVTARLDGLSGEEKNIVIGDLPEEAENPVVARLDGQDRNIAKQKRDDDNAVAKLEITKAELEAY